MSYKKRATGNHFPDTAAFFLKITTFATFVSKIRILTKNETIVEKITAGTKCAGWLLKYKAILLLILEKMKNSLSLSRAIFSRLIF